jgi:hypothetical protein
MTDFDYPSSYIDGYNPIKVIRKDRGVRLSVTNEQTGKNARVFGGRLVWIVNKYQSGVLNTFVTFNINDRKEAEAHAMEYVS